MEIKRTPGPGKDRLENLIKNGGNKVAKIGWFSSAKYPDGTPVAYVATIQEYGDKNSGIPPRSFMRPTIKEKQNDWRQIVKSGATKILEGSATMATILELVGLKAAGDIRKSISAVTEPPLSPRTIAARLSKKSDKKTEGLLTKPLVDTGLMLQTVSNVVEDKK